MKSVLQRLFAEPQLDIEESQRRSHLLGLIVWFSIVMNIFNMTLMLVTGADYVFWIDIALLVSQFALVVLYRRGYIQLTSIILLTSSWLFIASGINTFSDVLSQSFSVFFVLIIIGGLLLGGRGAFIIALVSIIFGGISVLNLQTSEARNVWLTSSVIMFSLAYLMHITQRSLDQALQRIRKQENIALNTSERLQQEIEERKLMAQRIEESEARYRAVLASAPIGIVVNDLEGTIKYANDHALKLFEASSPDELITRKSSEYFPEENQAMMQERLNLLKQGKSPALGDYRLKTLSGAIIDVEVGSLPFNYEGERAIIGIINDVSERRRLEEERINAERIKVELEQQRQYGKMRDEFITLISHEFRTPLSIINSSKDLLQRYSDKLTPEKSDQHFHKIGDQVTYIVAMLDHILALSQANAGMLLFQPDRHDIHALCETVINDHQTMDQDKHIFQLLAEATAEPVEVDSHMMTKVVDELLWNARNFSPEGAHIVLQIVHTATQVVITVYNEGTHVDETEKEALFQPFFRGKNANNVRGAGLGLAVVKEYVNSHHGTVTVVSTPDTGTKFIVTFPRVQQASLQQGTLQKDANVTDSDYNYTILEKNTGENEADGQNENYRNLRVGT